MTDVSKLGVSVCANNGGFYCEYLRATALFCRKYKRKLTFEPEKIIGFSFIEKCDDCLKDK
jgi:hypothetical protein